MKKLIIIAGLAVALASCATKDAPLTESQAEVVDTYLEGSLEWVALRVQTREFNQKDYPLEDDDEYVAAVEAAAQNRQIVTALKSAQAKLNQCLTDDLPLGSIVRCQYELAGIAAEIRVAMTPL